MIKGRLRCVQVDAPAAHLATPRAAPQRVRAAQGALETCRAPCFCHGAVLNGLVRGRQASARWHSGCADTGCEALDEVRPAVGRWVLSLIHLCVSQIGSTWLTASNGKGSQRQIPQHQRPRRHVHHRKRETMSSPVGIVARWNFCKQICPRTLMSWLWSVHTLTHKPQLHAPTQQVAECAPTVPVSATRRTMQLPHGLSLRCEQGCTRRI